MCVKKICAATSITRRIRPLRRHRAKKTFRQTEPTRAVEKHRRRVQSKKENSAKTRNSTGPCSCSSPGRCSRPLSQQQANKAVERGVARVRIVAIGIPFELEREARTFALRLRSA